MAADIGLEVFGMVFAASLIHASWNFAARKVKGDFTVMYVGNWLAISCLLPAVLYIYFWTNYNEQFDAPVWQKWLFVFLTATTHTIYFIFLSVAYKYGEISLVYPTARGTGVGITSVVAYFFLGENISWLGWIGIWTIVFGILCLGEVFSRCVPVLATGFTVQSIKNKCSKRPPPATIDIELDTKDLEEGTPLTAEESTTFSSNNSNEHSNNAAPILTHNDDSNQNTHDDADADADAPSTESETEQLVSSRQSENNQSDAQSENEAQSENQSESERALLTAGVESSSEKSGSMSAVNEQQLKSQQVRRSLYFALAVGVSISSYSLVDKLGVGTMHPVVYIFWMNFINLVQITPYVAYKLRPQLLNAVKQLKKYCVLIGPAQLTGYLLILFAFQAANVSYIVAMREVSVVFGALLGFLFLNEKMSPMRIIGICSIAAGLLLVKIA